MHIAAVVVNAAHIDNPDAFEAGVQYSHSNAPERPPFLDPATAARAGGFPEQAVSELRRHMDSHEHITEPRASPATRKTWPVSSLARLLEDTGSVEGEVVAALAAGRGLHFEGAGVVHHVDAAGLLVLGADDFERWVQLARDRPEGWVRDLETIFGAGACCALQLYGVQGADDEAQVLLNDSQTAAAERTVESGGGPFTSSLLDNRFWDRAAGAPGTFGSARELLLSPDVLQRLARPQFDPGCTDRLMHQLARSVSC